MSEHFFAFDDPDFDAALSRVVKDPPATESLIDQATASDPLWAALRGLNDHYPMLRRAVPDDETARMLTVLLAFTMGYRTGRAQSQD